MMFERRTRGDSSWPWGDWVPQVINLPSLADVVATHSTKSVLITRHDGRQIEYRYVEDVPPDEDLTGTEE